MAYEKTLWKDRVVEKPNTYRTVENPDGTITLYPITGQVIEKGTPISAANLNKIENGLVEVYEQLDKNTKNIKDISSYVTLEMFKLNVEVDYTNALISALKSGKSIKGDKTKIYNISKTCEVNKDNITIEDLVINPTAKIECFKLNNVNNITFRNNIFNISSQGGFAIGGIGKNITIENNVFNGGAPSIYIGDTSTWSNPTMSDNIIVKNNVYNGLSALGGGGSFCSVQNCGNLIFDGNIGSNASEFLDANNNILHVTCINNISTNFYDNHYDFNSCKRVIFSKNQMYQNTAYINRILNFTDFSSGDDLQITCDDIIVTDNIIIATLSSETKYSVVFAIGSGIELQFGRNIIVQNNKFDLGGSSLSISANILNKVMVKCNEFVNITLIHSSNTDGLISENTFRKCERLNLYNCIRNNIKDNKFIECNTSDTLLSGSLFLDGCSYCVIEGNYIYNKTIKQTAIGSRNGGTNTYIYNKAINNTNIVRNNVGDIVIQIPSS